MLSKSRQACQNREFLVMNVAMQLFLILFSVLTMFLFNFNGINALINQSFVLAIFNFGACLILLLNSFANTLILFEQLGWISIE
jgi:hypothetical protein